MSGEKETTIRIRRAEYDEMIHRIRRSEEMESEIANQMHRVHQNMASQFQRALDQQEQRNQARLSQLSGEMRQIEQGLQRQIAQVWNSMRDLREEMIARDEQLQQYIQQVQTELTGEINGLKQINRHAEATAAHWCTETERLLAFIDQNYRHQKFLPGALRKLQDRLVMARNDCQPGLAPAAVGIAQQTFLDAQLLRVQLEALEAQWNAQLARVREQAEQAEVAWQAGREPEFSFEVEGQVIRCQGKMDTWTDGAYSRLKTAMDRQRALLATPDNLTLDQLKQQSTAWEELRQEHERLVVLAKSAIVASQLRSDLAHLVVESLHERGWHLVESTYEGEDQARALHVKLKDAGDNTVVITYKPEQEKDCVVNRVNTAFFDVTTNDPAVRAVRMEGIVAAMRAEEAVECPDAKPVPGTEHGPCRDASRLDFARLKQTGPSRG